MKSYYSILSAMIRPEIQEKISIGFIFLDESSFKFEFSKHKLYIAKSLLSPDAYDTLYDALININKYATSIASAQKEKIFSASYIEYLSRYNSNVLAFSSLNQIDIPYNDTNFSILYRKFIDDNIIIAVEPKPFISKIQEFKKEKKTILQEHFNIDAKITSDEVEGLIVPVSVSLFGQNEVPTFVQAIDLERRSDYIRNDYAQILFLQSATKESFAMTITAEPNKILYPEQHKVWNQMRKVKNITNFDITEVEAILDYASVHNVVPFMN
jgi:hypothetical protein